MEKRNFCLEDMKNFLQEQVLHRPVAAVKQFDKGRLPVLCVTLDDAAETKLVVKFYRHRQDMFRSFKIAQAFGQNAALKCPRLYPLREGHFRYGSLYGLIYYYIEGGEIASSKIKPKHFEQLAVMYAVFQKTDMSGVDLPKDRVQNDYLALLRNYCRRLRKITVSPKSLFSKFYIMAFLKLCSGFLHKIETVYAKLSVPPQKITHNDMVKSNLLFKDDGFAAFLDMDSVIWSWPGRDCAEFIVSFVRRFRFWHSGRKAVGQWYAGIDKRLHFSETEYLYGLNIYYLYRIRHYILRRQYLAGFFKLYNFAQFIKLHKVIENELHRLKNNNRRI